MRPPHKLPSSYAGTPSHSSPHGGVLKRAPSFTDLSSRDKAKLYEKKRREERHINRLVSKVWEQTEMFDRLFKTQRLVVCNESFPHHAVFHCSSLYFCYISDFVCGFINLLHCYLFSACTKVNITTD